MSRHTTNSHPGAVGNGKRPASTAKAKMIRAALAVVGF